MGEGKESANGHGAEGPLEEGKNERRVNRMIENRQRNQDIPAEFLRRFSLSFPLAPPPSIPL